MLAGFYPQNVKETRKETIGNYKHLKTLAFIGVLSSGFVFYYASHLAGFLTLLVCSIVEGVLTSREHLIDMLYKIKCLTDARLRLLHHGDGEHALESLQRDATWRGERDQEVEDRLAEIRRNKAELKDRLANLLDELLPAPAPVDAIKKPDPN